MAIEEQLSSIALPRLATGVGGLNWDEIKPLIQEYLGDLAIPVYLYSKYVANKIANES